jgi:two-component sensor histidine kinase
MMHRLLTIFLGALILAVGGFPSLIDAHDPIDVFELKQILAENEVADRSKVEACIQLAKYYLYDSTDLSSYYARKGIRFSSLLGFNTGKGECQNLLALAHEIQGEIAEAQSIYEAAFTSLSSAGKTKEACDIIMNMGIAHYYAGDRGAALQYYDRALDYIRGKDLKDQQSKLLYSIAVIYNELDEFSDAVNMFQRSLDLKKEIGDSTGYASTLERIGLAYSELEDGSKATEYLTDAISWYETLGQEADAVQAKLSLSSVYLKLKVFDKAEEILYWMIQHEQASLLPHYQATAHLRLAHILAQRGELEATLVQLNAGYLLIKGSDRNALISEYLAVFSDTYERLKQLDVALEYTKQRIALLDTLNQKDRLETEREMKAKLDLQEKEAQIFVQRQKLIQQLRERQWFFALIAISFLLLAVLAFFTYSKARTNRSLREKNQIIDKSLREKEILLKEIHHRVKNNLQVVSSLLSLQARSLKGQEALEALAKGKDRVRSMALIHQNLYQGENLSGVNTKEYIDRLCKSLLNTYSVGQGNIKLTTEIESLVLDVDTVIPLGLILNELITNAIKYAFKPDEMGEIKISLTKHDESLEMVVADNGIGIAAGQFGEEQTMGYRLVKSFVQKLKGTYQVNTEKGTTVSFKFNSFRLAPAS